MYRKGRTKLETVKLDLQSAKSQTMDSVFTAPTIIQICGSHIIQNDILLHTSQTGRRGKLRQYMSVFLLYVRLSYATVYITSLRLPTFLKQ